jgi:hypothetical protein
MQNPPGVVPYNGVVGYSQMGYAQQGYQYQQGYPPQGQQGYQTQPYQYAPDFEPSAPPMHVLGAQEPAYVVSRSEDEQ